MENEIIDDDNLDNVVTQKKLKVACYIRVSTADQMDMYGPDLQIDRIRNYLRAREGDFVFAGEEISFEDPYIFYDGAVSGADKIEHREELSRLFYTLDFHGKDDKPFDIVLVYKIDRFARDLKILLEISDKLKEYGVGFVSTQESIDTSTPFGNAMLGILGVFAELEREMIRERTMLGMQESFKKGIAKKVPYGFRKDPNTGRPVIYDSEAEIVNEIFESVLLGKTIPDIIKDLIKRKVLIPTASGSDKSHYSRLNDVYKWEDSTIRKILTNEFYIGKLYYNKSKKVKDDKGKKKTIHLPKSSWLLSPVSHTPLVLEEDFVKVQEIIKVKKGNFHRSEKVYMLSGLIKCGYCEEHRPGGSIGWSGTGGGKGAYYHCNGKKSKNKIKGYLCKCIQLSKDDLETLVIKEIKGIFNNVDLLKEYVNKKHNRPNIIKRKERELHRVQDKLSKAENALKITEYMGDSGELTKENYIVKYEKQKLDIINIKKELKVITLSFDKLFNAEKYKKGLKILKSIVEDDIEKLFSDKQKIKHFLEFIIKDIYLYSRDRIDSDVIKGPKTDGQQVPYKMKIRFKLPQEFLREYIKFSINQK